MGRDRFFFPLKKTIVSFQKRRSKNDKRNDRFKNNSFLNVVFKTVVFKNDSISFKKTVVKRTIVFRFFKKIVFENDLMLSTVNDR